MGVYCRGSAGPFGGYTNLGPSGGGGGGDEREDGDTQPAAAPAAGTTTTTTTGTGGNPYYGQSPGAGYTRVAARHTLPSGQSQNFGQSTLYVCEGHLTGTTDCGADNDTILAVIPVPNVGSNTNINSLIPDNLKDRNLTIQFDYFDNRYDSFTYTPTQAKAMEAGGGEENGGGGPTPTPVPGLFCAGLAGSKIAPVMGDDLTLTCSAPTSKPVDHFEFRYQVDGGTFTNLTAGTAQTSGGQYIGTSQLNVSQAGSYSVQCRVCEDAASTMCTNWGYEQ